MAERASRRRGPANASEPAVVPVKQAFPPVLGAAPRVLILGSMPSEASLARGQYYGHPRNAFWPIINNLLGLPAGTDYARRTRTLREHHIALWDVIAACARPGSLDADIRPETVQVNDFAALFAAHPGIRCIAFNGGTAEREFNRRVLPTLPGNQLEMKRLRLPSTSPAHAGMRFEQKLAAWRAILGYLNGRPDNRSNAVP